MSRVTLTLRSPAFESGSPIPARFDHERGDGRDGTHPVRSTAHRHVSAIAPHSSYLPTPSGDVATSALTRLSPGLSAAAAIGYYGARGRGIPGPGGGGGGRAVSSGGARAVGAPPAPARAHPGRPPPPAPPPPAPASP